jgi:hypothetical protein
MANELVGYQWFEQTRMARNTPPGGAPGPKAKLPEVHDAETQRVVEWLRQGKQMQRPPEAAARLLTFIVKLHRTRTPFPTRGAVAKHLNIAVPTVDIVISNQIALGRLSMVVETTRGFVKQRPTVVQHKFIIPVEPELIKVVEDAEAELSSVKRSRKKQPKN